MLTEMLGADRKISMMVGMLRNVLLFVSLFAVLGCADPRHYKAYLFEGAGGAYQRDEVAEMDKEFNRIVDGAVYHDYDEKTDENGILEVMVNSVYLGQIQRDFLDQNGKPRIKRNARVYSGFETWIVAEAVSIDNQNPLLPAEDRHVGFTSVKTDQEAFAPIPISQKESKLFKLPRARDYRVTIKVYEVDGYRLKKALYGAKDTDLARWVYTTTTGALEALDNALTKSLFDVLRKKSDEENALEELLLSIGSDLEFEGTFYLLQNRERNEITSIASKGELKTYALVDILRSKFDHDGDYHTDNTSGLSIPPSGNEEYMKGLSAIRSTDSIRLDPLDNYYRVAQEEGEGDAKDPEFQSFVTFSVRKSD